MLKCTLYYSLTLQKPIEKICKYNESMHITNKNCCKKKKTKQIKPIKKQIKIIIMRMHFLLHLNKKAK